VNPVVAVLAGSFILSEPISAQLIAGGAVVVVGVAIMVTARNRALARGGASH
jgi:drug/metabolite transporter (DMT)-like permease